MNVRAYAITRWYGVALAGLLFATGAQADHHKEGMADKDIVATAMAAGQFDTLVTAVQEAGMVETLQGDGPFTVFAPTDEAFEALPDGTLDELLKPENQEQLKALLSYHVVPEKIMAKDAMQADSVTTVQGQDLNVSTQGETVMINDAQVVKADVKASNGVIHAIDGVLMPE